MNASKKIEQILDAAEEVMSEKGSQNSSIAEIAKKAEVTDSLIYNYFKGKEDLLFSVVGRRMKEILDTYLFEQLQGIPDPANKLSKMIWSHLHYNDTHPDYMRLLLFECRSNKNFYEHGAYALIRKYAGVMLDILQNGIKEGAFRDNINARLVRDIILGLLDWETLSYRTLKEINKSVTDLDGVLDIVLPMITSQAKSNDTQLDKSKRIFSAAEKIFAEKGYNQVTISDIAKLSNVSEGTIYEYFKNKEDLLLSIPKQRFEEHMQDLKEIFKLKTPLRKLRRFIRYHFFLYMSDPHFVKVFLLHIQLSQRFYNSTVYETFQKYTQILTDVLEEGKKDGSIRNNVNTRIFRNLFLGSFNHIALRWLILEEGGYTDKMGEIDEVVSLLSRAVATNPGD